MTQEVEMTDDQCADKAVELSNNLIKLAVEDVKLDARDFQKGDVTKVAIILTAMTAAVCRVIDATAVTREGLAHQIESLHHHIDEFPFTEKPRRH